MKTLICIFIGASTSTIEQLEIDFPASKPGKSSPGKVLAKAWENSLLGIDNIEVAVFLPGLMYSGDDYSATYRRFVQVGAEFEQKIQNVFELAFEKGYSNAIFVEDFVALSETNLIRESVVGVEEKDMVLATNPDGSVLLWGMNVEAYSSVSYFRPRQPESVVELLSLCNETNLSYRLLPGMDPELAFRKLSEQYLNQ